MHAILKLICYFSSNSLVHEEHVNSPDLCEHSSEHHSKTRSQQPNSNL